MPTLTGSSEIAERRSKTRSVATDTATEALQQRIRNSLEMLQTQIQTLTKQAAQVQHAEAAITGLKRKRATVARLKSQSQAALSDASAGG